MTKTPTTLAKEIEREMHRAWRDCSLYQNEHCALYENDLEQICPRNDKDRKKKLIKFAEQHGFRLRFYREGLCAIFGKLAPSILAHLKVAQVLTGLSITWPQATNGNLNNIKLGGTTIYNTPTAGGSLSTSSLLGTTAQRTIAAGSSATLQFTFQKNVDTNASDYTGSATFNTWGNVTTLP